MPGCKTFLKTLFFGQSTDNAIIIEEDYRRRNGSPTARQLLVLGNV